MKSHLRYWPLAESENTHLMSLLGVKRTRSGGTEMSACDPKRTVSRPFQCCYLSRYDPQNWGRLPMERLAVPLSTKCLFRLTQGSPLGTASQINEL